MRIYTDDKANRIVSEYRASGLSQRAYAARSGIKETTLSYLLYGRGRDRKKNADTPRFVSLQARPEPRIEYRIRVGGLELLSSQPPPVEYVAELARALS